MTEIVAYRRRTSVLEAEREYRVEPDALVIAESGTGGERRLPWSEVRRIRLSYAPTEFKLGRYILALAFGSGEKVQVDNMHWRGLGDFEDRSGSYRAFAAATAGRVAALAPAAKAEAGAPAWSWVIQILFLASAMTLLSFVVIGLGAFGGAFELVRMALVVAMLPAAAVWMVRARPRPLDLNALPESVLPPEPAA